jgi:hypothetical protein
MTYRQRLRVMTAVLMGAASVAAAGDTPAGRLLREPAVSLPDEGVAARPEIVASRYVSVDFSVMSNTGRPDGVSPLGTTRLVLDLFPAEGASYTAIHERTEPASDGRYAWVGRLDGVDKSGVVMIVDPARRTVTGNITLPGRFYQIRPVKAGLHAVYRVDQARFPEEREPIVPPAAPESEARPDGAETAQDTAGQIDVLVVWTASAATAAGGTVAMQNLVDLAITETNQSYANSGITQRLRLVNKQAVTYNENDAGACGGDVFSCALSRLSGTTDGYMDNVHTLRNTYGADEVALIINNNQYCGLAYLQTTVSAAFATSAFAVADWTCSTGYYSFGHELGHNMGAHHDRFVAPENGAYAYSHGYVDPAQTWRTVMAYGNACGGCTRIQWWSNPDILRSGTPMGVAEGQPTAADNRKTLNNTALTVANFRQAVDGTPALAKCCDFNADGKPDILWRNQATGDNAVWYMNNTTTAGLAMLSALPDPNWRIAGAADFNADTKPDLLWRNMATGQNAFWYMNGASVTGYAFTPTLADTNWRIVGAADFNADTKPDILWRNVATGQNALWYLNGTTLTGNALIASLADLNWHMVGIGDLNADNKPDIVWRNVTTGENAVWYMNGATVASVAFLTTLADPNWKIVGVGDYNADNKPDLVWRDQVSGMDAYWYLNGAATAGVAFFTSVAGPDWRIVPSDF